MDSYEERIETYYHSGTRELAEWLVDLEDSYETRGHMMTDLEYRLRLLRIERDAYKALATDLEERSNTLARLEAAGVDNWDGYSQAFEED